MTRLNSALPSLACVFALLLAILLVHPVLEMGFWDDFSYIWVEEVFRKTGHVQYHGWGAMPLGWQLPLGALFTRLFGFSFTVVRLPVFLLSLALAAGLPPVLRRCGLGRGASVFGTLTLLFSPLVLPLTYSFMTDVPALLCLLLCFWACLRAYSAATDRAAVQWLLAAALSNALLGTVRQVVWLGVLVMVPCAAWALRRRRGVPVAVALAWLVSAGFIDAALHWFKRQPYTFPEPLLVKGINSLTMDVHAALTLMLCTLPLGMVFLSAYPYRQLSQPDRGRLGGLGAVLLVSYLGLVLWHHNLAMPYSIDGLSRAGVIIPYTMLGLRPTVMPFSFQVAVSVLLAAGLLATALFFLRPPPVTTVRDGQDDSRASGVPQRATVTGRYLVLLLVPYCVVYVLLIYTRRNLYDRYFSPLLFAAVVLLLHAYARRSSGRIPALASAVLAAVAVLMTASTHDLFSTMRARLAVAEALQARGIARAQFSAGLEYDGWTQLQLAGYIQNPRLPGATPPADGASESALLNLPADCSFWYQPWMPALHTRYLLSYVPVCPEPPGSVHTAAPAQLGPFPYRTWLSPRERFLYVTEIPEQYRWQH